MRRVRADGRRREPVEEWLEGIPSGRALAEVASLLRAAAGGAVRSVEGAEGVAVLLQADQMSASDLDRLCRDGGWRREVASVARLLAASELAKGSGGSASQLGRRWVVAAAVLAATVAGVLLAPQVIERGRDAGEHRAGTIEVADVQVIGSHGVLPAAPLIEWRPVLGADLYEVEVTTADGGMIFLGRTIGTELQIPSDILAPSVRYFYRVRARVEVSRWISSEFREFVLK